MHDCRPATVPHQSPKLLLTGSACLAQCLDADRLKRHARFPKNKDILTRAEFKGKQAKIPSTVRHAASPELKGTRQPTANRSAVLLIYSAASFPASPSRASVEEEIRETGRYSGTGGQGVQEQHCQISSGQPMSRFLPQTASTTVV